MSPSNDQEMKNKNWRFFILILILFVFRLLYGLSSEFWFEDELQIYLIGLKSFTTHTWPYYGPDVVYTNTQIPGALQGLLVAVPLYLLSIPESPTVFLNILSFASLGLFAWYVTKRIMQLPVWLIWVWIMTLTWTMNYSTRVVNPSYVLVFAVPFFIAVFELLPIYKVKIVPVILCFFVLGAMPFLIMQLHLSYVLLVPFVGLVWYYNWRSSSIKENIQNFVFFATGSFLGMATLIPTFLLADQAKGVGSNVVLNLENYKNVITILTRYLSFASYEIPYIIGTDSEQRLAIIKEYSWMLPFGLYLLLLGFVLVVVFVVVFFKNKAGEEWVRIKYLTLGAYVMVFLSFFFSIKGPSSHTFYILLPLPVFYSFYCYQWLWVKYRWFKNVMYAAVVSCVFFYTGLGLYNLHHKSLYKDREKVVRAINSEDYRILGERRADKWGYGY